MTQASGFNGSTPGGGGGGSATGGNNGGSGGAGKVALTFTASSSPYANSVRFLLDIPSTGGVNGAIYGRFTTAGTIAKCDVIYGTGGTLQVIGYDSGGTAKFTSTAAGSYNGTPVIVSVELTPSGTSVAWALKTIPPGASQTATTLDSGTVSSASIGGVNDVLSNPGGTETGAVGAGHYIVQGVVTSLPDLAYAASGYDGEYAADRFTRLCTEAGITYSLVGTNTDTPQMGPQPDDTLVNILQSVENLDCGLLFETRDAFGLSYRTRVDMQNQTAVLTLDYSAAQLAQSMQPTYDDQLIRNDVTVSRVNGSSAREVQATGTMSTQPPPNGVGTYAYSRTVYAHADSQLDNEAKWLLSLGTVDEERYPQVPLDLSRSAVASLFSDIAGMDIGDFFEITNMPDFMGGGTPKQLAWGLNETLNAFTWQISPNAVPESPYEGASLPTW